MNTYLVTIRVPAENAQDAIKQVKQIPDAVPHEARPAKQREAP